MIMSNHGVCKLDGKGIELLYELNQIFDMILEEQPELLTAVAAAWSPAIEKCTDNLDKKLVASLFMASEDIRKELEK